MTITTAADRCPDHETGACVVDDTLYDCKLMTTSVGNLSRQSRLFCHPPSNTRGFGWEASSCPWRKCTSLTLQQLQTAVEMPAILFVDRGCPSLGSAFGAASVPPGAKSR